MILTKFYKGMQPHHVSQGFHDKHPALDIVFKWGTPICAPENCLVLGINGDGFTPGSTSAFIKGYGIKLKGLETGREYLLWHCASHFPVWGGDTVKRGQIVAFMSNSGYVLVGGKFVNIWDRDMLDDSGKVVLETPGTHIHAEGEEGGVKIDLVPLINWSWEPNYSRADHIKAITNTLIKIARSVK